MALLADLAGRTEALREFVVRRVADLKLLDGRLDDVVGSRHLERFDTDELHYTAERTEKHAHHVCLHARTAMQRRGPLGWQRGRHV